MDMPRPVAATLYGPTPYGLQWLHRFTGPIHLVYRTTGPVGWLREGRYGVNLYAYVLLN